MDPGCGRVVYLSIGPHGDFPAFILAGSARVRQRLLAIPALVLALGTGMAAPPTGQGPTPAGDPADLTALLDRLETFWGKKDAAGYLSLWDFERPELREEEADTIRSVFEAEENQLMLQRPSPGASGGDRLRADAQVFSTTEPRARVRQWRFRMERRGERLAIVEREELGQVDGLIHLSLDPQGFRADGQVVRLEDFELRLEKGTIFTAPADLGPTALLFVGEGHVRVSPRPPAEKEQLRQFCGQPTLVDKVGAAFIRLHPADLHRLLEPARLVPDPEARQRWGTAQRFYREQSQKAFVLDTSLPRSPWWLLPSLGDAVVTFETARRGTLTFGVAGSDAEDLTLFDRRKRLQICMYPSAGRSTRYSEDDARALDVLAHDLRVRFDPGALSISGEDTLRLRLLSSASTLRLRLHDSFRVISVTSPRGGSHLFFRVRDQGSLVVSLGPYAGRVGEVSLTVRYVGIHDPAPIDQETLQVTPAPQAAVPIDEDVFIERVPVYTNRTAWYPRGDVDDHSTARLRFEAPPGYFVVSGGELVREGMEGGRSFAEYRQDEPGKYITAAVGRFVDLGLRQEGRLAVRGFGLPRTREEARSLQLATEKVMAFLADLYGPCPYSFLNLAVLEGRTPGGHSPPGMVLIQQRPPLLVGRSVLRDDPASFWDIPGFFLTHELAHQWWGQGVAPENYRERWLSEGMAQYATALWVRKTRGEGVFRGVLDRFAVWAWRHTDAGPINLGHRLGHLRGDPQVYRAIIYDKGAYVLHMLRGIVGEEVFDQAIRGFLEAHRFSKAGTDDLREALEAASGKDLQPYFESWIHGTALPVLRYTVRTEAGGSGYRTAVEVRPRNLPGPVPLQISVTTEGGRQDETVSLPPEGGRFLVATTQAPRKVEINGDRGLLARLERP